MPWFRKIRFCRKICTISSMFSVWRSHGTLPWLQFLVLHRARLLAYISCGKKCSKLKNVFSFSTKSLLCVFFSPAHWLDWQTLFTENYEAYFDETFFVENNLCTGWPRRSRTGFGSLDMGSSPGWQAATVATYCPSRMTEYSKTKSTKPRSETFWVTL